MKTNVPINVEEEEEGSLITSLPPKLQRFVHLYTTGQYSQAKLAQLLDVHINTIGKWLKRKDVQDAIFDLQDTTHFMVAFQLKNLSTKATDKLRELMDSPIDGVALQAVKDVLDRAGHKQKTEIKVDKTVTTIEQKLGSLIDSTISEDDIIDAVLVGEE